MQSQREVNLINQLRKGNRLAFDVLYHQYFAKLFGFTQQLTNSKEDAEEIVQEVFIKIWEIREDLITNKSFSGLLFTIARHKIYNRARHQVYQYAYQTYYKRNNNEASFQVEQEINYQETKHFLNKAIDQLPPKRRHIFTLSRIEGLSNKEIAEKINTSTSNVENQINKALKFLRTQFSGHEAILLLLGSLLF